MCEAEVELNTQEVRSGQWTEEAKYQFLLRIILQLKDDRETISWSRINMPGRTTKSLQNQWTKVQKQLAELDKRANTDGGGEASPKTPKSTPRKRRTKKSETDEKTEEGGNGEQDATRSKKRASAGENPQGAKKAKQEGLDTSDG